MYTILSCSLHCNYHTDHVNKGENKNLFPSIVIQTVYLLSATFSPGYNQRSYKLNQNTAFTSLLQT